MLIGIPKEIKNNENRVAMTPNGAARLIKQGHQLRVETGAGFGSGFSDAQYQQAGADMVTTAQAWDAELVVKVKEPQADEYAFLNGQMLFTFLHLSGVPRSLTEALLDKKVTAIAYETLEDEQGRIPILAPMSAIAGNMATLVGSFYLAKFNQGSGVQLGRVLGQPSGKVVVIGAGVVGQHAAQVAHGMGARVWMAGRDAAEVERIRRTMPPDVQAVLSTADTIAELVVDADLVIGAVLCHGEKAPKVVTEAMVNTMPSGSVLVDVSIDQGGCFETSKPTTHAEPVFIKHGVLHYCVANMPGAYPRTATIALENAAMGYTEQLAAQGLAFLGSAPHLAKAVNTHQGFVTCSTVANDLELMACYRDFLSLL